MRDADARLRDDATVRWTCHLPRGVALERRGDALACAPPPPARSDGRVRVDGRLAHLRVAFGHDAGLGGAAGHAVPAPPGAALDLRPRRDGDAFHAPWRDGPAKLVAFLRGQGVVAAARDAVPLLCVGSRVLAVFLPDRVVCAREIDGDEVLRVALVEDSGT